MNALLGPPDKPQDSVPADLMRAAELAAYEALKEDHREPPALWMALIRHAVAGVLPLHEQQVRAQLLAEQEQERQDAYVRAEQEFLDAWNAAPRDRALRIMPDGALTWRRRTPEERRAYLTEHRGEALAYGIPVDLVDLMIGDAEEVGSDEQ